jgi:hypothetical protein
MSDPKTPVPEVDLGAWKDVGPHDLLTNPALFRDSSLATAAARARAYARSGGVACYDEIGFRSSAATPVKGQVPLRTIAGMRLAWEAARKKHLDPAIEEILDQQLALRHRPLDLPSEGGYRFRYEVSRDHMNFTFVSDTPHGRVEGDTWTFPITTPPSMLLEQGAEDRDVSPVLAQLVSVSIPCGFWLPATALVEAGRFERMQDWRDVLTDELTPGRFYCFISHRWRTPTHPDPDGIHARFVAWQVFAHLCEAVRVAHLRGLDAPRRFSTSLGFPIGPHGSQLAESILVNVLRPARDPALVAEAASEVASVEELVENYGLAATAEDEGLRALAGVLRSRPVLADLMGRVLLWYDYSCMPQQPRSADEEALFREGLNFLNGVQALGSTAVVLDDVEDYLGRAWCTLEVIVADTQLQSIDLLVGSRHDTTDDGLVEQFFTEALEDRPHLVWRALLDTEVFRIQTPTEFFERLDLRATDAGDLPYIYERLGSLAAPKKVHVDDSELLTGVVPLPAGDRPGTACWATDSGQQVWVGAPPSEERTLDWSPALSIHDGWRATGAADGLTPPFFRFDDEPDAGESEPERPICHVAVIASCEGEAVLLSHWVRKHRSELESAVDARVASMSWLASDIAPVGHFFDGDLKAAAVRADTWVVIAASTRLAHCPITGLLADLARRSAARAFTLAVDEPKRNLVPLPRPKDADTVEGSEGKFLTVDVGEAGPPVHRGGLFRGAVMEHLLGSPADARAR